MTRKLRSFSAVGASALFLALAGISSAQDRRPSIEYTQRVDTAVTIDRQGTVNVSLFSGRVRVAGAGGSQVRVRGSVEPGGFELRTSPAGVRITVEPNARRSRGAGELELTVPFGTHVVLETHSASVAVAGVKGDVKAESLSGGISIADAAGKVIAESVSGGIEISRLTGDLRVESVSGRLELSGISGDIDAESVSGRITVVGARSKSVRAESVSGRVAYSSPLDPAGNYKFASHSGTLTLALPSASGATVSLETFSGNVDSDFPVTLQSGTSGRHHDNKFEFRIGNGRARVIAETFSGNILIRRGLDRDNPE